MLVASWCYWVSANQTSNGDKQCIHLLSSPWTSKVGTAKLSLRSANRNVSYIFQRRSRPQDAAHIAQSYPWSKLQALTISCILSFAIHNPRKSQVRIFIQSPLLLLLVGYLTVLVCLCGGISTSQWHHVKFVSNSEGTLNSGNLPSIWAVDCGHPQDTILTW